MCPYYSRPLQLGTMLTIRIETFLERKKEGKKVNLVGPWSRSSKSVIQFAVTYLTYYSEWIISSPIETNFPMTYMLHV
jgi:hypothetical protein